MRPVSSEQDPLRHPLNELLGTRANVRLLRVMVNEVEGPLTASDVAERAGLTVPGAQKALKALCESGFVARIGGGRKHQYEIRRSDWLMQITTNLFKAEKDRYVKLLDEIRKEIKNLTQPPHAVWIQALPKTREDPLTLGLLHETRQLTICSRQLRAKLNRIEKDFDLTIELEAYTKADISNLNLDDVTVLYGLLSSGGDQRLRSAKQPMTHQEKDQQLQKRSLNLAKAIESDSSLIRRAKEHVDRLLNEDQGAANRDLLEWRDILDLHSIQRLTQFLTSSSERANRLRQSNPFFAVLTPVERAKLAADMGDDNDA